MFTFLTCRLDPYAVMGDLVASAISSPMLSFKDAPMYTLMEEHVVRAARRKLGYTGEGDGMVTPGGSLAVIAAIHAARAVKFPSTLKKGNFEQRLTFYISENAHYANNKAALFEGKFLKS